VADREELEVVERGDEDLELGEEHTGVRMGL